MKKFLLPLLALLFALPAFSQYVHRNTLIGTGLKNVGSQTTSYIGTSVSISADGSVAVVCGGLDSAAHGAAWVYTRSGTTWTQMGKKLVPTNFSGTMGVNFGYASAISANGNTIAIGGYFDGNKKGATWVFERQGNVWVQQGPKLVGTTTFSTVFQGENIPLSSDGNTLLVGGKEDNGTNGAVWVFQRTGTTWAQQAKLTITPNNSWAFGASVAVSADGNTALVGVPLQRIGAVSNINGFGHFYKRTGSTWNAVQLVTDSAIADSQIATSVALSADGKVAALGGPENNQGKGAIWIYRFNQAKQKWVKEDMLVPANVLPSSRIGTYISISRGGDTLVTSGFKESSNVGAIYFYTRNNGVWSQLGTKLLSPITGGTVPQFGRSISISGDGKILIAGRPGGLGQGAALVFYTPDILSTKKELQPELKLYPNPVTDFLYLPATATYSQLIVSDLSGKVLLSQTKPAQRLDLSTFSAGIYIVSLQQQDKVQHVRIVKQ